MTRIVLLGATGYTGSRVLDRLAALGAETDLVLVGRSAVRQRAVADAAGIDAQIVEADTSVPGALDDLLTGDDVVVSTVGPFGDLGPETARSAARAGAVYLDSTGEPPFIAWMMRELTAPARASGALLIPAFGYDYVPGNLAGWLAAQRGGPATAAVEVGYFMRRADGADPDAGGGRKNPLAELTATTTGGTRASLIKVLGDPSFAFRADAADPFGLTRQNSGAGLVEFTDERGRVRPAITVGGSEHFGLPEVLPGLRAVDVGLGWFGAASRTVHRMSRMSGPLMVNPVARKIMSVLGDRLPGRDSEPTVATETLVFGRARDADGAVLAETTVTGPGPYELTADLLARGALHFAAGGDTTGVRESGVRGPLAGLGPEQLVALADECGLRG